MWLPDTVTKLRFNTGSSPIALKLGVIIIIGPFSIADEQTVTILHSALC